MPTFYFLYTNILEANPKAELVLTIFLFFVFFGEGGAGRHGAERTGVNVHFFKLVATDIKFKIPLKCRKFDLWTICSKFTANIPASLETVLCYKLGISPNL